MFEFDKELLKKDDDTFHFVAYVPVKGRLYELDGLKEGPVDVGKCDESDWLATVRPVLNKRMQRQDSLNLLSLASGWNISWIESHFYSSPISKCYQPPLVYH